MFSELRTASRTWLQWFSVVAALACSRDRGAPEADAAPLTRIGTLRAALSARDAAGGCGLPPDFHGIGDLEGGAHSSAALAVSADGRKVVGQGTDDSGARAVAWTVDAGLEALAESPSAAQAISDDGNVIAGFAQTVPWAEYGNRRSLRMSARWVGSGPIEFVTLPYRFFQHCDTASITGDGETIWGRGNQHPPQTPEIGFVWHGSSFEVSGVYVRNASSFDGNTAVGVQYRSPRHGGYTYAMLDGEPLPFPDFEPACASPECVPPCAEPGDCEASANGVSEDGRVIVGSARFVSGEGPARAVRWQIDAETGGVSSSFLSVIASEALALSDDGRIAAGDERPEDEPVATLWINGQTRRVDALLAAAGVLPDGWRLTRVNGLSPDGHFLVGEGFNLSGDGEGWVAHLPQL
jgi:hypothetical protein